jgi:hypothetical protein
MKGCPLPTHQAQHLSFEIDHLYKKIRKCNIEVGSGVLEWP